ncbi:MAG: biotin/lipoyl-containing protein, partial [Hyphomicrobiaceae bacterium]|nr:biotin/lipoyl-containing protein [Hyphomicrobiaceae bacterium]
MQILVPPLSQTSDTLVLVEWRKRVGEPVAKGDILFTVETDKATLEVESPGSGILQAIYAQPNDEIAVRSVIGVIAEEDAPLPPAEPRPALPARHDWIFASPRARHLARREGAALSNMRPTGPRGMIVERDVRAYLAERDAP